ncbi:MAG TPA: hypothetical protein VHC18_03480, partial [Amycolatopsis sp.]|nr:hypothetical protein [Amycolatopsis sp.]
AGGPDDGAPPRTRAGGPLMGEVWFFDVDACLVDSMSGASLRPLARPILEVLHGRGALVVWWSAGGATHARDMARRHDVAALVHDFLDKPPRGADGRWSLAGLPSGLRPDFCVDDRPEDTPLGPRTVAVPPYLAPDPHDRGLRDLHICLTTENQNMI